MVDQAVMDKLDAGFKKLQAANECHSLLKKHLTKDIYDQLKCKKTDMGATLLDVVQSGLFSCEIIGRCATHFSFFSLVGMENLDSGVGIYAPDAQAYKTFSALFDPIIDDYHKGFKPTDKHPKTDFGDLNYFVNVDPKNEYVISTRVRCGRSLQGYPFNPMLTEAVS